MCSFVSFQKRIELFGGPNTIKSWESSSWSNIHIHLSLLSLSSRGSLLISQLRALWRLKLLKCCISKAVICIENFLWIILLFILSVEADFMIHLTVSLKIVENPVHDFWPWVNSLTQDYSGTTLPIYVYLNILLFQMSQLTPLRNLRLLLFGHYFCNRENVWKLRDERYLDEPSNIRLNYRNISYFVSSAI